MTTQSLAGKYVMVSGIAHGREIFLGRAIDEPFSDQLSVEGKMIDVTPQGFIVAKPFTTLIQFPVRDANCQIQQITNPEARNEAEKILTMSVIHLQRMAFPLVCRWVESSIKREIPLAWPTNGHHAGPNGIPAVHPLLAFQEGFMATAQHFHRILFRSPQVTTTRELDKLSELEGDLVIEIGKVTNQVVVKFNQLITNETELTRYFELVEGPGTQIPITHGLSGWVHLIGRLDIAKGWARRNGKTPLVREINTLTKENITRVNEIILDHCSALDTLIAETCNQYGIAPEMYGELSPVASYTAPYRGTVETLETATSAPLIAAGI